MTEQEQWRYDRIACPLLGAWGHDPECQDRLVLADYLEELGQAALALFARQDKPQHALLYCGLDAFGVRYVETAGKLLRHGHQTNSRPKLTLYRAPSRLCICNAGMASLAGETLAVSNASVGEIAVLCGESGGEEMVQRMPPGLSTVFWGVPGSWRVGWPAPLYRAFGLLADWRSRYGLDADKR